MFSLAHDYNDAGTWLFGGIWRVEERLPDRYIVSLTNQLKPFIKRLRFAVDHRDRQIRNLMTTYYDRMVVNDVLPQPFVSREFPGLESLTVRFSELEGLVQQGVKEWREPLSAVRGIYLLRDEKENANYVGATYGE